MELLVGTYLYESSRTGTTYLKQLGAGPALGIYQMEPATHRWLRDEFLRRVRLRTRLNPLVEGTAGKMVYDLEYATRMARLRYWFVKDALPPPGDAAALGWYYKAHYNTPAGAGSAEEWTALYLKEGRQ